MKNTASQNGAFYIDYCYIGPALSQDLSQESTPDIYGYDNSYTDDHGISNGESLFIEGKGVKLSATTTTYSLATFTFKGTGFDIISRTGEQQATFRVDVKNTAGETEKALSVNNKGELELYQIPVVSIEDLPYGEHTVTIQVNKAMTYSGVLAPLSRGGEFYLDAIRIYDPISTAKDELSMDEETALSAYTDDGEAYPYRKEVRDILLSVDDFNGLTGETDGIVYIDQADDTPKVTQPEDSATTDATEYVPIDPETGKPVESLPVDPDIDVDNHITDSIATCEKIGPKNEVYLGTDQSVAFKLRLNTNEIPVSIDVGAKAINSTDAPQLVVGHTTDETAPTILQTWDISTNTALYYRTNITAQDFATDDGAGGYLYLVITNKGANSVLSITDIKFGYDTEYTLIQEGDAPVKRAVTETEPVSFMVDGGLVPAVGRVLNAEIPEEDTVIVDENLSIKHTLNLASDISINFALSAESLKEYDSYYLLCQLYNGQVVRIDPVLNGNYYYFTLTGLTAVNINDEVKATVHMTKDGQLYQSAVDTYSVAQYAYSQLSKAGNSEKLKSLCADLLRYGATAQIYKNYRTDALADSAMTEDQMAYLTDLDSVIFGNTNEQVSDLEAPTVTWAGKALNLESKVALKYIIDTTAYAGEVSDLVLRVSYVDGVGQEVKTTVTDLEIYNAGKNQYAFSFDGLLAAELRTVVSVAVYAGEIQVSNTLRYSADTYGANKSGVLGDLCRALMAYSDRAKAYFATTK